ncbi:MAG: hypothetical protein MUF42_11755 [Cytophagaceae bacterium]|jgi:hypothetical protein|nr:hypothetical protein [Cytophagaceae bacterium]
MKISKLIILSVLAFVMLSCNKKKSEENNPGPANSSNENGATVHVTGDYYVNSFSAITSAAYWKDGMKINFYPVMLPNQFNYVNGANWEADTALVCGYESMGNSGGYVWKINSKTGKVFQGISLIASNGGQNAKSYDVFGDGKKVYACGYFALATSPVKIKGCYWVNETCYGLETNTNTSGIVAVNGDVYVVGRDFSSAGELKAVFWKNGIKYSLSNSKSAYAESVVTDGNYLYICGTDTVSVPVTTSEGLYMANRHHVKVWKVSLSNLSSITETDFTQTSIYENYCNEIFYLNGDVYVCGNTQVNSKSVANYWKNGQEVSLSSGTNDANAYDIVVHGSDVYVAGYEKNAGGKQVAKYWKNGTSVDLSDGSTNASAKAIFVSDKK